MTQTLYLTDPYLQKTEATVVNVTPEGAVVPDRSVFYPQGGGQPGDTGWICWDDQELSVSNTVKTSAGQIALISEQPGILPEIGQRIVLRLDWDRRFRHMRVHTGLHLLSVVIPLPVTGGAITAIKGRLDFDMPQALENKDALEADLNALIARDLPITESWITDSELEANPGLVKTMSVKPPTGAGHVRLIRIGDGETQVDLQPCGGTHVARTGEIGQIRLGKIEKKGAQNRRVNMLLA